jgi:hypothetical protein
MFMAISDIDRLICLIKELGISDAEFARNLGIAPQNIQIFKKGERPVSPKIWIRAIKKFPQFNPRWVATGEGEIYLEKKTSGNIITGSKNLTAGGDISNAKNKSADTGEYQKLLQEKDERLKEKDERLKEKNERLKEKDDYIEELKKQIEFLRNLVKS